ncbi:MAG: Lon-insertion domain-containing protein, partial [Candidatus Micrarchaeota archaeon]
IAQEIRKDGKIPHMDRDSMERIIEEGRGIAKRVDNVRGFTLRLRNLSGIIKMAGDMAATEKKPLIERKDVEAAIKESRPIEEKLREKYGSWYSAEVADFGVRSEKAGPETA